MDISWAFSKEHVAHLLHKLQRMPPCDFTLDTIELTKKLASTSHHGPAIGRSGMVRARPLSVRCCCRPATEPTRMQRVGFYPMVCRVTWPGCTCCTCLCPIVYCMCCVSHDLCFCRLGMRASWHVLNRCCLDACRTWRDGLCVFVFMPCMRVCVCVVDRLGWWCRRCFGTSSLDT